VFAWLIYRINTPALRMLFMSPSNRFSLRDGLIAMLAGQAPRGPRELARVMLFKGIYYVASVLHRFGIADEVQSAPAE
jgi:hypothetical protein